MPITFLVTFTFLLFDIGVCLPVNIENRLSLNTNQNPEKKKTKNSSRSIQESELKSWKNWKDAKKKHPKFIYVCLKMKLILIKTCGGTKHSVLN